MNRSPTFALRDMTPEEAWSGRKPAVDHVYVFRSIAYVHVTESKRKKLDDRGDKCVFLGVSKESKAYKLFNPLTKKVVTSRDVVFDEENTWDWYIHQSTPILFNNEVEEAVATTEISTEEVDETSPAVCKKLLEQISLFVVLAEGLHV